MAGVLTEDWSCRGIRLRWAIQNPFNIRFWDGQLNQTCYRGWLGGLGLFESVLTECSSWDGGVDLGLALVGHLVEMTEPRPLMILGLGTASSPRHTL